MGPGVIGDDESLADHMMSGSSTSGYAMMSARAHQNTFGAQTPILDRYLTATGLAELPNAEGGCLGSVASYFASFSPSTLFNLPPRPTLTKAELAYLEPNVVGRRKGSGPILLVHGTSDTVVPSSVVHDWTVWACTPQVIDLRWYAGAGHMPIGESYSEVLEWIADRFAGSAAPNTCGAVPPPP